MQPWVLAHPSLGLLVVLAGKVMSGLCQQWTSHSGSCEACVNVTRIAHRTAISYLVRVHVLAVGLAPAYGLSEVDVA